ncbi:glutathione S-transferase [Pelagibacterium halotolerans]|nr:glutathione S-transferase [Pelagibacterium halotolerans]
MVLRSSSTSPFGRKVRMVLHLLGLADRYDLVMASTVDEADTLRDQNPLGKIPCLILPDGPILFDSRTIVEYLCDQVSGQTLFPTEPLELALMRTDVVLADGVADAALLMVYEGRFRGPEQRSDIWLAHQRGKILRALNHFATNPPVLDPHLSAAAVSLSCALGYLDWRNPVDWRPEFPTLVAWLDTFEARHPDLAAMRPTASQGAA